MVQDLLYPSQAGVRGRFRVCGRGLPYIANHGHLCGDDGEVMPIRFLAPL